ncbi:IclR family transcriptional regulator [Dictyobacter aurantiacus]|uniref:Transcriptional regulator n=1 Tax=Dictyobacter aurantiacus TaxID=1936993 RepID=A0A401ZMD6_9CHLR|nr:IclR family transcriptional regulator [Dictyobacter aurantiacus]GCE07984.1 transcriptional regulator [Dictyobacter aurantiacus]
MAQPRPNERPLQGETAQTLDRGLRVLDILASYPAGLSVPDIAQALNIHRTIAYRLLNTLVAHRLVRRTEDNRYCLGIGLIELARHVVPRLQEAAYPAMRQLAEELRATACLTIMDGDEGVVLTTLEPRTTTMHIAYRPGFRHMLDKGASGLAILAGRPRQPGERREITMARKRGYATSYDEIQYGASGIAAPIQPDGQQAEASIGVVLLGKIDEATFAPHIIAAAHTIASALLT